MPYPLYFHSGPYFHHFLRWEWGLLWLLQARGVLSVTLNWRLLFRFGYRYQQTLKSSFLVSEVKDVAYLKTPVALFHVHFIFFVATPSSFQKLITTVLCLTGGSLQVHKLSVNFLFTFWGLGRGQILFLTLFLRTTPCERWGIIRGAWDWTWARCVQGNNFAYRQYHVSGPWSIF